MLKKELSNENKKKGMPVELIKKELSNKGKKKEMMCIRNTHLHTYYKLNLT